MGGNSGGNAGGFGAGGYGEPDRGRAARPAGAQRAALLIVRQGKEPGRTYEVRKDRMTIGRSRESDIFLEDLAVSRTHTSVGRDEQGRYIVRDENSANGTYVNGQRISEYLLEDGDEIQIGQTVLAFTRR
jgi:pSer/pThr/pTyr-binding forkhead associated (FHA) protein